MMPDPYMQMQQQQPGTLEGMLGQGARVGLDAAQMYGLMQGNPMYQRFINEQFDALQQGLMPPPTPASIDPRTMQSPLRTSMAGNVADPNYASRRVFGGGSRTGRTINPGKAASSSVEDVLKTASAKPAKEVAKETTERMGQKVGKQIAKGIGKEGAEALAKSGLTKAARMGLKAVPYVGQAMMVWDIIDALRTGDQLMRQRMSKPQISPYDFSDINPQRRY